MIRECIEKLSMGENLSAAEIEAVMEEMVNGGATPSQIGAFLIALKIKRETPAELAAFASFMRKKAVKLPLAPDGVFDTAGTGGDRFKTFNVSTAAALTLAAGGIRVAKHGNRAVSSSSGSADLLELMGVKIDVSPDVVARCIIESGIGFVYAPAFHPAMKAIAPVRRELGVRTVFNLLGPLTNPLQVKRQLVGVAERYMVPLFTEALTRLGSEFSYVVHGLDGVDEVSLCAPTVVGVVDSEGTRTFTLNPEDLGTHPVQPSVLRAGTPRESALTVYRVLSGRLTRDDPRLMFVAANTGLAIHAAGRSSTIAEGVNMAAELLCSGKPATVLRTLVHASGGDPGRLEEIEKLA